MRKFSFLTNYPWRLVFIAVWLVAASSFGQSAVYNIPYNPQPCIKIPHIEPAQVTVDTNDVISANQYRNLKYCDFVLKCIDQGEHYGAVDKDGNSTPLLYLYSSVEILDHPGFDLNAVVYFQNDGMSWPQNTMRRQKLFADWRQLTSIGAAFPDEIQCDGEITLDYGVGTQIVDNWTMNQITNFTDLGVTLLNGQNLFEPIDESANYPAYWSSSWSNPVNYGWFGYVWRENPMLGPVGWVFVVVTYEKAGAWINVDQGSLSPFLNDHISTTNTPPELPATIMAASTNTASAIEVYPDVTGRSRWLFPGNDRVKWMCLVNNGIDFFCDPVSGRPMWFNCAVEWVSTVPNAGQWTN